jgi:hypothetical protein
MHTDPYEDYNPNSSYYRNHTTEYDDDDQNEYYDDVDSQNKSNDAYEALR